MKKIKSLLMLGICLAAFAIQSMGQDLPEVTVVSRNYKYLKSVDNKDAAQQVKLLERKAAVYDVKNSEYYEDDYDTYYITFYLPRGYVLAVYDQDGKLLRTAEKYKNISLPSAVSQAVVKRYPNWAISEDTYVVRYEDANGAQTTYKMQLQNGNKRIRVKTNANGEFLD